VAEVMIDIRLPNGGRYRDEERHLWTFGEEGKVVRLRHYVDTAKHIAAAHGRDTTAREAMPAQV
jgi:ketosteroid isomerase-like protein